MSRSESDVLKLNAQGLPKSYQFDPGPTQVWAEFGLRLILA